MVNHHLLIRLIIKIFEWSRWKSNNCCSRHPKKFKWQVGSYLSHLIHRKNSTPFFQKQKIHRHALILRLVKKTTIGYVIQDLQCRRSRKRRCESRGKRRKRLLVKEGSEVRGTLAMLGAIPPLVWMFDHSESEPFSYSFSFLHFFFPLFMLENMIAMWVLKLKVIVGLLPKVLSPLQYLCVLLPPTSQLHPYPLIP